MFLLAIRRQGLWKGHPLKEAAMKNQRHALESHFISILNLEKASALQLMGMLYVLGFKFDRETLRTDSKMAEQYSRSKVIKLVRARMELCQRLFNTLCSQYGDMAIYRLDDGSFIWGHVHMLASDTHEEAMERADHWLSIDGLARTQRENIFYLNHLEKKFVEAVRMGDANIFMQAIDYNQTESDA